MQSVNAPSSLGIVQPYLFPYLGYYQLVNHCDAFVFFDTVNFIKRAYVNRNAILLQGQAKRFTLPVMSASQNSAIGSLFYANEHDKLIKTIEHAYKKAPFFQDVMPLVTSVLQSKERNVAKLNALSITEVMAYLSINKRYYFASELSFDASGNASDTLCAITKALGADTYCNPIGGESLYSKADFLKQGISLCFCKKNELVYKQNSEVFVDNLSIIDVLMWNSPEQVQKLLYAYQLR